MYRPPAVRGAGFYSPAIAVDMGVTLVLEHAFIIQSFEKEITKTK